MRYVFRFSQKNYLYGPKGMQHQILILIIFISSLDLAEIYNTYCILNNSALTRCTPKSFVPCFIIPRIRSELKLKDDFETG
jgi:hypothetical protein